MSSLDNPFVETIFDAYRDFNMVGDHRVAFDGATTGGTSVITTAAVTMNFTSEDVGRRITLAGAGVGGAVYVGTITSINTTQSVNVSPATTTTVSAKGVQAGTDNTAAINAFVNFVNTTSATFPGVKLKFGQSPTNAWGWPVRAVFNKPVYFEGIGGNFNVDAGDYTRTGGTRIAWWSDTEDGGVEFGPWFSFDVAAGGTQPIIAPSFRQIWLDGRNGDQSQALIGVRFAGCFQAILEDVFFIDCKIPVLCESTTVTLSPVSSQGVLRPSFIRTNFRNLETFTGAILTPITTSTAITLTNTGQNITVSAATMPTTVNSRYAWVATNEGAPCLVLYTGGGTTTLNVKCSPADAIYTYATVSGGNVVSAAPNNGPMILASGNSTSNTNLGLVQQIQGSYGVNWGPAALELRNSDSMLLKGIILNGGNNTNDGAINRRRRPGVRITGSNHATTATAIALASRNHIFFDIEPGSASGGGISATGVTNAAAKLSAPSGPTYVEQYQLGNGAPIPFQESFSSFYWNPNGGVPAGMAGAATVAIDSHGAATTAIIIGSQVVIPPQGFQAGTSFRWFFTGNPTTGAAVASTWTLRVGGNGTTGDAIIATQAFTGTAATNIFKMIWEWTIRAPGAATTSFLTAHLINTAATGIANIATPFLSLTTPACATFSNITSGLLYVELVLQTGAGQVVAINQCTVEVTKSANP